MKDCGWRLSFNGATVVEITGDSGGWLVGGMTGRGTSLGSIEEAVGATPSARALEGRGTWRIDTQLPTWEALDLLDEPGEGVDEVAINDDVFVVLADEQGRFLFHPKYWPPDEPEREEVLQIGCKSPGYGSPAGSPTYADWISRVRGVYELTSSEDGAFENVDPSPFASDLEACRDLLTWVDGPVVSLYRYSEAPLTEVEVADLIMKVSCPYGVVWFDNELWRARPAPTRVHPGSLCRLPIEPTRAWWEIDPGTWVSGRLGDPQNLDLTVRAEEWWAVLLPNEADLRLLLAADFAADEFEDDGYRQGVILDLPQGPIFGLQVVSDKLACRYADLLGGVPVAGDSTQVNELGVDGAALRTWAWSPRPVAPPTLAGRIHAAWSVIEDR
ncbi:MAG: hypothetical protein M3083_00800 [Actinomycetota bacterium]|nr:hypothetical protein [Actinomycetota bacterium]MDQ6944783.1 hypothetical protein [Actinomycetota bacterium]